MELCCPLCQITAVKRPCIVRRDCKNLRGILQNRLERLFVSFISKYPYYINNPAVCKTFLNRPAQKPDAVCVIVIFPPWSRSRDSGRPVSPGR